VVVREVNGLLLEVDPPGATQRVVAQR
jgi:hypothetical protein